MPRLLLGSFLVLLLEVATPSAAITVGAIGDSLTDEYGAYLSGYLTPMPQVFPADPQPSGPDPLNWVEQLASDRSSELDFGASASVPRPEPRLLGYANDWARAGATTTTASSAGQVTGVAAAGLDLVYVGIGTNNVAPIDYPALGLVDVFGGIYDGCETLMSCSTPFLGSNGVSYSSVEDYVADVVSDIAAAVAAIGASGADIVLGNILDWGTSRRASRAFRSRIQAVTPIWAGGSS